MGQGYERKPPIEGRGLVSVGDFARAAGLDRSAVEALARDGRLDGVADRDGRVVGLFDDVLPTSEQLRAMGLAPKGDYNADDLRGVEDDVDDMDDMDDMDEADERGPDSGSPSWTMGWPGEAPE